MASISGLNRPDTPEQARVHINEGLKKRINNLYGMVSDHDLEAIEVKDSTPEWLYADGKPAPVKNVILKIKQDGYWWEGVAVDKDKIDTEVIPIP